MSNDVLANWVNNMVESVPMYLVEEHMRQYDWEVTFYDLDTCAMCVDDFYIPMWSTAFYVNNPFLGDYILEHVENVCGAGFVVMHYVDNGDVYLGIDGAGYDFYSHHWAKLYDMYASYLDIPHD